MPLYVRSGGVWRTCTTATGVHAAGAWHALQQGWVRVSGVWQIFFNAFAPVNHTYSNSGVTSETIPTGASQVVIEGWGSGGAGGNTAVSGGVHASGGGGGGGAYFKKTLTLASGNWGQTFAMPNGTVAGVNAVVQSGTFSAPTLTAGAGAGGGSAVPNPGGFPPTPGFGGMGGTASGADVNTTGNNGTNGGGGVVPGGAAITGTYAGPYGAGGSGGYSATPAGPSTPGGISFHYT